MAGVLGPQYGPGGAWVLGPQYTSNSGGQRLRTKRSKLKPSPAALRFSSFDSDEDIQQALQMLMPLFQLGVFNG